jgi:diguanylate cyclase (GGDEF)-like protein
MTHSISNRLVGRMAAVLFLAAGLVSTLTAFLPIQEGASRAGELVVGLTAIAVAVFAWTAPWERWPRSRSLWLPVLAFAILAATYVTDASSEATFATYFVVVFVWVGVCHPRWTSVRLLPLGVAGYVTPLVATGGGVTAIDSTLEVGVLCGLVGEALAWVSEKLRVAEVVDERRGYQMQMLLRSAELLARENDPTRLPRLVVDLAVQLLRTDAAIVLLVEGDETLRTAASYGWPDAPAELSIAGSAAVRRLLEGDQVAMLDRDAAQGDLRPLLAHPAVLVLPLPGTARTQGLLAAAGREAHVDDFGRDVALTFATQAGLALERVRASQALLEESLRDELTGLGNRRYANLALADSAVGDAIVMIDLDQFKDLNDRDGHAAGDRILRELAAHLRGTLREDDLAARMGGDEFLLILRRARDHAFATVDRLEERWRAGDPPVTYSAGIAVRLDGESTDRTLARADAALYAAKQQGRARVSLAAEP